MLCEVSFRRTACRPTRYPKTAITSPLDTLKENVQMGETSDTVDGVKLGKILHCEIFNSECRLCRLMFVRVQCHVDEHDKRVGRHCY